MAAFMVTVQTLALVESQPVHEPKVCVLKGDAVMVTTAPGRKVLVQLMVSVLTRQLMRPPVPALASS